MTHSQSPDNESPVTHWQVFYFSAAGFILHGTLPIFVKFLSENKSLSIPSMLPLTLTGLSIGGLMSVVLKRKIYWHNSPLIFCLALAFSLTCNFFVSSSLFKMLLLTPPFVVIGFVLSTGMAHLKKPQVYMSDLLGALAGALFVLYIVPQIGGESTFLLLLTGALWPLKSPPLRPFFSTKNFGPRILFVLLLMATGFQWTAQKIDFTWLAITLNHPSSQTTSSLSHALKSPLVRHLSTVWDPLTRIDLVQAPNLFAELHRDPDLLSYPDPTDFDFLTSHHYFFDGTLYGVEGSTDGPLHPLFSNPSVQKALFIGSGLGRDFQPLLSRETVAITAVEAFETLTRAAQTLLQDHRERIEFISAEGRHFIHREKRQFDLIDLAASGLRSTAIGTDLQSFLFTTEAMASYIEHLTPEGILHIRHFCHTQSSFCPNAYKTFRVGVQNAGHSPSTQTAFFIEEKKALQLYGGANYFFMHLYFKKKPLSPREKTQLREWHHNHTDTGEETPPVAPQKYLAAAETLFTDHSPYFWPAAFARQQSVVFFWSLALFLIFLAPLTVKYLKDHPMTPLHRQQLLHGIVFSSLLGLGYIFFQIGLLQKYILWIGHPTKTFFVVVISTLFGGLLAALKKSPLPDKVLSPLFIGLGLLGVFSLVGPLSALQRVISTPQMQIATVVLLSLGVGGLSGSLYLSLLTRMSKICTHGGSICYLFNTLFLVLGAPLVLILVAQCGVPHTGWSLLIIYFSAALLYKWTPYRWARR